MHFHFSFYSSLLLILFSQGMLFSILLFKKGFKVGQQSYYWLSLFIFLCSLFILPWMLGHAGWYSLQPYRDIMFYIPMQQQLLIGPVIFFYTQSLLNQSFSLQKKDWLHLLPAFIYLLYSLLVFITDKLVLQQYFFYANGRDKDLDSWYQMAGLVSMLVYGLLSIRYYALYKKIIYQATSFADKLLFNWVKKYLFAFFFMQLVMLCLLLFYPRWGSFSQKWWYYFFFACLYYYIALTAYANQIKSIVFFRASNWLNEPVYLLNEYKQPGGLLPLPLIEKENMLTLDAASATEKDSLLPELEDWKQKIAAQMETEKLYQNPELTLKELAEKLCSNTAVISKAVNQGFKMNFNDFVNQYRIKAVKILFKKGEHKTQTLLAIAFECGFNSKTTFNRAFKKHNGLSPKEYLSEKNN